ncbi:MAG: hypothetical protein HYR60_30715, partial [Acidobacteria bacterium]|nr:hypothetical protein [Acidobacteriota bacterium]
MKSVQRILLVGCAGLLGLAQDDRTERMRRRLEDFYQRRAFPRESIPAGARARAIQEMNRMVERERALARQKGVAASPERWTPIGPQPTNVGPTAGTFPYSSGRVSALAVDPRNPDVAYLGGAHGGVWKTTDGGRNWTSLTDSQISLATGSIALDPRNPDIVYAGTGEQNFSGDSYYGAGILKSADRGLSWTHLPGPFVGPFTAGTGAGGARIGAISIHPVRSEVLLAGVQRTPTASAGIFRSTDGGVTWTNVLAGASGTAVFFDPKNGDVAYAALGDPNTNPRNGAYKSTDGGLTWNTASGTGALSLPATFVGRIAMAGSASNPSVIYAGIHSVQPGANDGLRGLFKSDDGAQTWRQLAAPDYCQPQCWYNNVLAVSPVDPNLVVAAGFTIYRSVNGGQSWAVTSVGPSGAATHVDHHALAFSADGTRVYNGNDGGVWSSPNLASAAINWTNLNATLSLTQFNWGISIHPRDVNIGYGGTQDNGTQRYSGKPAWDAFVGGDGGATAIDPLDPSTVYGGFFGLSLHKTSASANFSASMSISHGIDQRDRSPFYPTLSMDPSNPLKLYFGTYRVYRTTDGAGVWRPISPDLSLVAERPNERSVVTTIAVAPGDTNVLYAETGNGRVPVSTNAGADWTDITGTLPLRAVTRVAVDPVHAAIAYVAFSGFFGFGTDNQGHIFKTVDFGQT